MLATVSAENQKIFVKSQLKIVLIINRLKALRVFLDIYKQGDGTGSVKNVLLFVQRKAERTIGVYTIRRLEHDLWNTTI